MSLNAETWLAILGMAAATYATRALGLFAVSRMTLPPAADACLKAVPGSIIAAIVAPTVLASGPAESLAGLAALTSAAITKNILLALVIGVASCWALRLVV